MFKFQEINDKWFSSLLYDIDQELKDFDQQFWKDEEQGYVIEFFDYHLLFDMEELVFRLELARPRAKLELSMNDTGPYGYFLTCGVKCHA